jgi:rRNA small subunit pseudouridine methyltransferase Nep1
MLKLPDAAKRGRPDITHFVLLEALGSPLNKEGQLRVFVHTINNQVITVNPASRLPRNYNRFIGLMEQLFEQQKVPQEGETLLALEQKTLQQLIKQIRPDHVLAFSTAGKPKTIQEVVSGLEAKTNPAVVIGAFPHGHFSEATLKLVNETVCVDPEMLNAWTVASRVIYEYEQLFMIPKKRLGNLDC